MAPYVHTDSLAQKVSTKAATALRKNLKRRVWGAVAALVLTCCARESVWMYGAKFCPSSSCGQKAFDRDVNAA